MTLFELCIFGIGVQVKLLEKTEYGRRWEYFCIAGGMKNNFDSIRFHKRTTFYVLLEPFSAYNYGIDRNNETLKSYLKLPKVFCMNLFGFRYEKAFMGKYKMEEKA
jgi:hypothetical protein